MTLRLDKTGFGNVEIYQDDEEFCYGIDAVLLADFAATQTGHITDKTKIMDLGTGTGIIPLILSHKTKAGLIYGIEVQKRSFDLALRNAEHNNLEDRLFFRHEDVSQFDEKKCMNEFDVVTCNPPYTAENCGIKSSNRAKNIARHETVAALEDFLILAYNLLRDKGDFFMVHRPARLIDICEICRKIGLEPKKIQFVSGKPMEKPNIMLIHCIKNGKKELKIMTPIAVHEINGSYSREIFDIYEKNIGEDI